MARNNICSVSSHCSPPTFFPITKTKGKKVKLIYLCITGFVDITFILGRKVSKMQCWSLFNVELRIFFRYQFLIFSDNFKCMYLLPFICKREKSANGNLLTTYFVVLTQLSKWYKKCGDIRDHWRNSRYCCFPNCSFRQQSFLQLCGFCP